MIRSKNRHAIVSLVLACCTLPAGAQSMKPGLWELSSKVSSADGALQAAMSQAQQQLANMPPEQRAAMQKMMEQHGVQLDLGANGDLRTRMCMTREMAERRELPVQQGDCTQKATPVSSTRVKVSFVCTRPRASGEGEVTMESDTRYRARMKIRNDEQNQAVDMDVSGRWLSADCGKVNPITLPPAK